MRIVKAFNNTVLYPYFDRTLTVLIPSLKAGDFLGILVAIIDDVRIMAESRGMILVDTAEKDKKMPRK